MSVVTTTRKVGSVFGWLLFAAASAALVVGATLAPGWSAAAVVLIGIAALASRVLSHLHAWQQLAFVGLTGYVVLGYGFTNLALPGAPIPVGHLLMLGALALALPNRGADLRAFVREPAVWCWLLLLAQSMLHLLDQIPRFGLYAVRDASALLEGVFLLIGFLWARQRNGLPSFARALLVLFVINLAYALTFPVADALIAASPTSGIFLEVPLLGTYWHTMVFLVAGALYFLLLGGQAVRWPPVLVGGLALLQLLWSLVFQTRSMYVGIVAAAAILVLAGERRTAARAVGAIATSLLAVAVLGTLGIGLEGRFGMLTPEFLVQHVRSIFLAPGTPGVETAEWRVELVPQIVERFTASATTIAVGEGFGEPLTDWEVSGEIGVLGTGVQVRQPHNTHVTVLMRLGLVGLLLWTLMHARITYLLVRSIRAAPRSTAARGFAVWMLAFYALGMLFTSTQPWLEFSHGSIPFYALIGFALGLASHPPGGGKENEHRSGGR